MKNILVTGSNGFIGKNLIQALSRYEEINILHFDVDNSLDELSTHLDTADFIYHLAGVNRPKNEDEFKEINTGLTQTIVDLLSKKGRNVPIAMTSSIQAELDNPYGISKKNAENALMNYGKSMKCPICIYRLPNVFGKWCRPNYNSVVATFCHKIAHGEEIWVSDETHEIALVYIDDVVKNLVSLPGEKLSMGESHYSISRTFKITLGRLVELITSFKEMRTSSILPNFSDGLTKFLYLSYLEENDFAYDVELKKDERGHLFELLKSPSFGQIFVSTTKKGVTRGNHYHNSKVEKFCLVKGNAKIRLRRIEGEEIIDYEVSDKNIRIVDIPPGYTHSIENIGEDEMIVIFWANEVFDNNDPDTFYEVVQK